MSSVCDVTALRNHCLASLMAWSSSCLMLASLCSSSCAEPPALPTALPSADADVATALLAWLGAEHSEQWRLQAQAEQGG